MRLITASDSAQEKIVFVLVLVLVLLLELVLDPSVSQAPLHTILQTSDIRDSSFLSLTTPKDARPEPVKNQRSQQNPQLPHTPVRTGSASF